MTLEPSSYTDEKYELFRTYQTSVHQDRTTPDGFTQFLVDSPLKVGPHFLGDLQLTVAEDKSDTLQFYPTHTSPQTIRLLPSVVPAGR